MARIQKGGVRTQEIGKKLVCLMAVFFVASMGAVALVGSDDSDAGYIIDSETEGLDYVKTSGTYVFTVENTSLDKVYCRWYLNNSSGKSQSNGTVDIESGTKENVSLTAPSTAGDYKFLVKFYSKTEKADSDYIAERQKSLKVVEPVTIKVTFENNSTTKVTFDAYLMVKKNGEWQKVDDSTKSVTVSACTTSSNTAGTGTYSFDYVTRDLDRTTSYKIMSDDTVAKGQINGLDKEMTFYTSQNNYAFITWFMIIVLVILLVIIVWIYRKPVKNFGKPKGRR